MRIPVYERRAGVSPLSIPAQQVQPQLSDNGESVGKTLADTFERLQKFTEDLEDTQTLEAFNKFKLDSQAYHEDPDKGIYHTRIGGQSFGLFHDADEWMRRKGEDYARTLPSSRAKRAFRKMAREHIIQQGMRNSRFEAGEMRKYRIETADASIKNSMIFVGQNWDNPEAIEQARTEIAQALELKMRGSSTDAFKHAMAEYEDQIGIARITQAFVQDPMLAVELLKDKDIHLKPDTRAKLVESLKNKTEIYRMQAIVEQYAPQYSPENAVELQQKLIDRYNADEGNKAFAAVSRYWSIQNTQKRARKQSELETIQANEDKMLERLNNNDSTLTADEVRKANVRPEFKYTVIARLEARQKQAETEQKKKDKAEADLEMFRRENSGEYFTNEELEQGVKSGAYTDSEARQHKNIRDTTARRNETERLQKAKDDFASKFYSATLTVQDIDYAVAQHFLDPNDAITLRNMLRTEQERKERGEKLQAEQAQKEFEAGLRIIVNNGGIIKRKEVNELLNAKKISPSLAEYLWRHEDAYDREQAQMQKAADTAQAKADKQARKNQLYKVAQNLFVKFGLGHEGEGLEEIQRLGLDVDEQDFVRQHYNSLIQDAKTKKKNSDDEHEAILETAFQSMKASAMLADSSAMVKEFRKTYDNMYASGELNRTRYNELIGILDEKERNFKQIAKDKEDADNKDIAKDYFDRFGLEGIHQARKELGDLYPDTKKIRGINYWLDEYARNAREQKSDEAKALRDQQEQTFIDLRNQYWRQGKSVPAEELSRLEKSKGLTPEQVQRAHGLNMAITTKKGMEDELAQNPATNWFNLSPTQREALVMQHMGTDENKRRENVAYLIRKVLDGSSSDWEIMEYEAAGRIAGADVDTIKNFDKKFDRARKLQIRNTRREIEDMIKDLHNNKSKDYGAVLRDALIHFDNLTGQLDPRATDFEKTLKEYMQDAMMPVLKNFEETRDLTSGFWFWEGPSAAGERYQAAVQKLDEYLVPALTQMGILPYLSAEGQTQAITPTGETVPYNNTAPAVPSAPTPAPVQTEPAQTDTSSIRNAVLSESNPDNMNYTPYSGEISSARQAIRTQNSNSLSGLSDVTKSILDGTAFRVTSPFSYTRTALRNGRSHLAVDLGVPVGTPVHTPQYGGLWKVVKTGENSTAGKFIKIHSYLDSGDVHEYTYAHLNSWDFKEGDTVSQGDIVAKSGNTGHSTGPHLHVALKVNGKPTDPTKVYINGGAAMRPGPTIERAEYLPQPLEEIQRMTDEEAFSDFKQILGLGNSVFSNDVPNGILSTTPNYGSHFGGDYY